MQIIEKGKKTVIGMIHTIASPGTPKYGNSINEIIDKACSEAEIYSKYNFDTIILENMHDVPYMNRKVGPEVTAVMTAVALNVRKIFPGSIGIQILAGANSDALAIALAANLQFIRAEGFVYSHIADEGMMNACAGELLRYRKNIGADHIKVFTDIKKKHSSHSITSDVNLTETARAAEFFLSDGLIVTGASTGLPADVNDAEQLYSSTNLPIMIGSGITASNVKDYLPCADGFIVGSFFKDNNFWANQINTKNIESLLSAMSCYI